MKKAKFVLSFVAIAFAGICTMTSCSKQQLTDQPATLETMEGLSKNALNISNENNPYDYCGRIHNEILDYIIKNNPNPTHEEIFNLTQEYLQNQYGLSSNLTFENANKDFNTTTEFILEAFLQNKSFENLLDSKVIAGVLDTLVAYSNSIIKENKLPFPQTYANYIKKQENMILEMRNEAGISPDEVSEYDVALGAFAIARYSYSYWYDVAKNPENPWNKINMNFKRQDDNDPKPGFWKRLWDGVCEVVTEVAEVVVKVAVTPIVDVVGFAWEGMIPNDNPRTFGPKFDFVAGIHGAGDWSAEVWY